MMIDDPNGYINLLNDCPICSGDIEPHCQSHACDIVRCQSCKQIGSIDGRWWPKVKRKGSRRPVVYDESELP